MSVLMPPSQIRNVWAIGRNYADHAKELGNAVPAASGDPMIFLKAGSSIVENGGEFHMPKFTSDIHHEVEVVLQFGAGDTPQALPRLVGLTVGIDLTAREVQTKLKDKGHPWTLAKSFRGACLLGPLIPLPEKLDLKAIEFSLRVNGEIRQQGNTRDMIHPITKQRDFLLENFPVVAGDLVMTGTPVGVAALHPGDRLEAEILGLVKATWTVAR